MKYDVDSIKHDLNYIYKYNFGLVERYLLYLEVKKELYVVAFYIVFRLYIIKIEAIEKGVE